jgi:hypothetical protein
MANPWDSDPVATAQPSSPADAPAADAPAADAPWMADQAVNDAPPAPEGSGFTDEQHQQIVAYLPKAKDAADLEKFSRELSNGRVHLANADAVMNAYRNGQREFTWATPTIRPDQPQQQQPDQATVRDAIGDGILNGLDMVFPGLGTFLRQNRESGRAFTASAANGAVADYGPEIGGFLDTLTSPSQYGDFSANLDRNVAHERAILTGETQGHTGASIAGELTGAAL